MCSQPGEAYVLRSTSTTYQYAADSAAWLSSYYYLMICRFVGLEDGAARNPGAAKGCRDGKHDTGRCADCTLNRYMLLFVLSSIPPLFPLYTFLFALTVRLFVPSLFPAVTAGVVHSFFQTPKIRC